MWNTVACSRSPRTGPTQGTGLTPCGSRWASSGRRRTPAAYVAPTTNRSRSRDACRSIDDTHWAVLLPTPKRRLRTGCDCASNVAFPHIPLDLGVARSMLEMSRLRGTKGIDVRLKRAAVVIATASLLALAACGGGGGESPGSINPSASGKGGGAGAAKTPDAKGPLAIPADAAQGGTATVLTLQVPATFDPTRAYYTDSTEIMNLVTRALTQ